MSGELRGGASVHRSRRQRPAEERALVLRSEGMEPLVRREPEGFTVWVAEADSERAVAVLREWEEENLAPPRPPDPRFERFPLESMVLLWGAAVLFFLVTGPWDRETAWFAHGSSRAALVLQGEWWRALTALTLHADLGHVLGNALTGFLFVGTLCRSLGVGLACSTVVAAGALGNISNALLYQSRHDSVGASTAVFAAIGALSVIAIARRLRGGEWGKRAAAPLAAGLGLLAMLGTSEHSDVWAHVFGLVCGALVTAPLAWALPNAPGRPVQVACGVAGTLAILAAWALALASGA